ncbi:MAG: efflux transporter, family, subunit [Ignavibacteria bacterium]|nr:efflux transporter, family, subunit [Ignavibacteria bacterium]
MKKGKLILWTVVLGFIAIFVIKVLSKTSDGKAAPEAPVFAVTTQQVQVGKIDGIMNYTGTVEGIAEAAIISQTAGVIEKVNFNVGQRVAAGSVLAVIENVQQKAATEQAGAAVLAAETGYEKAKNDLARIESLFSQNVATKDNLEMSQLGVKSALAQLKGAQAAQKVAEKQLADTYIKATISGAAATKDINVGGTIAPGMRVTQVVDLSKLKIKINVNENDVAKIIVGKRVDVRIDAYPDKIFEGKIATIGLFAGINVRTYQVEVLLDNRNTHEIKSGMFARCQIMTQSNENALIVPETAVTLNNDGSANVFVIDNGKAFLKKVIVGLKNAGKYEITSGIAPGAKVAVLGKERLADGMIVREK